MGREGFLVVLISFCFFVICIAVLFSTKKVFENEKKLNKKLILVFLVCVLFVVYCLGAFYKLDLTIFFQAFLRSLIIMSILFIIRDSFGINDKISKEMIIIVGVILGIAISLSCNYL